MPTFQRVQAFTEARAHLSEVGQQSRHHGIASLDAPVQMVKDQIRFVTQMQIGAKRMAKAQVPTRAEQKRTA